jgi:DNA-directed RNA polymerase subunit H (RpoH/RPB5)
MHALQPKHIRLKPEEVKQVISKLNISVSQLPRIKIIDPGIPEGCNVGDVIRIERYLGDKLRIYYRVVV